MHTIQVLAGGFALLLLCFFVGRWRGGSPGAARGALVFIPLWLVAAAINMYFGVAHAGYTVADETPMFFVVFGIPALVALGLWRWARR